MSTNRILLLMDRGRCQAQRVIDKLSPELERIEHASEGLVNFWTPGADELSRKGDSYRLRWFLHRDGDDEDDERGVPFDDDVTAAMLAELRDLADRLLATCERLEGGCVNEA